MLFLPSFDPETSHNLAIHLASIWRDTQIGLISAFFVPTQETQNWGYLTCCCCCETKSWGQFYFYAFCNLFSFSFFRPWKVSSFEFIHCRSCIFSPFYFGLKPISNAWVIIYFELSSFLYRAKHESLWTKNFKLSIFWQWWFSCYIEKQSSDRMDSRLFSWSFFKAEEMMVSVF